MHIFFLGFMGTGKSHWGKALAHENNIPFIDLDHLIEETYGQTIAEIFAIKGEQSFREMEAETLRSLGEHNTDLIVSTGGGTPCFHENMSWMNKQGITIFLSASPEFVVKNVANEKAHRPLISHLSDTELMTFADQKMQERYPFYSQAGYILNAERVDIKMLQQILYKNK